MFTLAVRVNAHVNAHASLCFATRTRRLLLIARNTQDFWRQRRWHGRLGLSLLFSMLLLLTGLAPAYADTSGTNAQVTVDLHRVLSTVSPLALGVNAAVWDSHLQD